MSTKFGGRPQKVDLEKIINAALDVGVANLSMRAVASKLDVSSAALYRYVDSIEALLDACMDAFCERIELPDAALDWQDYLLELGLAYRHALLSMPGISSYGMRFGPTTPAAFKLIDTVLGVLMRNGFEPVQAWSAFSLIGSYSFSTVQSQENFLALERQHGDGGYKIMRLQAPDLEQTPYLAKALFTLRQEPGFPNFAQRYEEQLKCLVAGIAARHQE